MYEILIIFSIGWKKICNSCNTILWSIHQKHLHILAIPEQRGLKENEERDKQAYKS